MNRKQFSIFLLFILIITVTSILPVEGSTIWSDEYRLTKVLRSDILSDIAQTNDDRIWFLWQSDRRESIGNFTIYYKIYNVNNGTWGNETIFTRDPSLNLAPSVTQTSNGTIWVVWASNREGNYDLFYKTSIDNGVSWSNETRLTTDLAGDYVPCVMQAKDEKLWVVWQRTIGTNKEIFYKTFDGSTWSSDTSLVTNQYVDTQPSIMQANDGKIWVFWCSNRVENGKNFEIFYKTFNGSTWSSDTQLTFSSKDDDEDPTAFLALDGTIWVIWTARGEQPTATNDLYYMVSSNNGTTWSLSVQLTLDPGDDLWPSAIQASDKRIWITWTSNRNDNNDIYYKFTLRGDVNNNGVIDMADLNLIARALWTTPASDGTPGDWGAWNPSCELNNDDIIDVVDLAIASMNYGRAA